MIIDRCTLIQVRVPPSITAVPPGGAVTGPTTTFPTETFPKTLNSSSKKDFSNKFLGKEGAPVTLRCEASGVPPPTIQVGLQKQGMCQAPALGGWFGHRGVSLARV